MEPNNGEEVIEEEVIDSAAPEEEARAQDPAAELDKWKDVAARAQADLDNFRKRMAREKSEAIQYANRNLL